MADERKNSRLPPPAFPPGVRRLVRRNHAGAPKPRPPAVGETAEDAFISPDEPLPPRRDKLEHALILPDEPLPSRGSDALRGARISPEGPLPPRGVQGPSDEEGVVMGIGSDPHLAPEEIASGGDPYVLEVVEAVRKLSEALRRKGEAGLRTTPSMSRFEATLRAYCVGYLAGRRAEDEARREEAAARVQPKGAPPDV